MKGVHRLAAPHEKEVYPDAHTFNRATKRYHTYSGFEIPGSAEIPGPRRARKRTASPEAAK